MLSVFSDFKEDKRNCHCYGNCFCTVKFYPTKIEMDVWFFQDNLNFQARCLDTFDELLTNYQRYQSDCLMLRTIMS